MVFPIRNARLPVLYFLQRGGNVIGRGSDMTQDTRKFGISDKRGRARTSDNPYATNNLREPAFCTECHAVYQDKHWALVTPENQPADAEAIICPACQKIAEGYAQGVVTLQGDYLWSHEKEILNMLHNEEQKARSKNPLERIMRMTSEDERMVIETTEQKLAEHLGRALHKAHQGNLVISRPKDHLTCRVTWERIN